MTTKTSDILFEKFEIVDVLKKNEHAGVYIAFHKYLEKKIVLKVLNTKTIGDEAIVERFKREAKTLAKLEHKNIIRVLDFGMYENYFYISFEYFKSENLRSFLKSKNLSEDQKEKLVEQFLHGLSYAHQNNIIHRDIKPENILVNEDCELKLSDFGLALSSGDEFVTKQYSIVGTPTYMSPEQIKGEVLTKQTDMFSAGIVIYEIYKGTNPFLGSGINESINNITNFKENKFEASLTDLPEKIISILKKLLVKDLEKRCSDVNEVINDLGLLTEESSGEFKSGLKDGKKKYIPVMLILVVLAAVVSFYFHDFLQTDKALTETVKSAQKKTDELITGNSKENSELKEEIKNEIPLPTNKNLEKENEPVQKNIAQEVKGSLFIECLPWADVFIDGKKIETTPLKNNIVLAGGVHKLKLVHPDFPEYNSNIVINEDQITNLKVNLDTLFGYLDLNVLPWGNVFLDKKELGETPFLNPLKIFPGSHTLIISNPKFGKVEEKINVQQNDTITFTHRFQ